MKLALIGIPLMILVIVICGIANELNKHHWAAILWRWFTGLPYHGRIHPHGYAWFKRVKHQENIRAWYRLPRIYRAGHRLGGTVFALMLAIGMLRFRGITILSLEIGAGLSVILGGCLGIRKGRRAYNDRTLVSPLAEGLSGILALPADETQRAIALPPAALTVKDGELGSITLPAHFRASPNERGAVEHLIATRMPREVEFAWHTSKTPQTVSIRTASKPPPMVKFGSLAADMEACAKGTIVLGMGSRSKIREGSLIADNPHWGFAIDSGMGKTTFLLSAASQILHNDPGAKVTIIDPKMSGATALAGIPGVTISADPANIEHMVGCIKDYHADMMSRIREQRDNPTKEFPINALFIDELPSFSVMLKTWWMQEKEKNDPATPILWPTVIGPILWQGRAASCHMIVFGQQLYERTMGGIGIRPSLGVRGIAPVNTRVWDMLVGTRPVPSGIGHKNKGRWIFSIPGDEPFWVQTPFAEFQEFRTYAQSGRRNAGRVVIPMPGGSSGQGSGPERPAEPPPAATPAPAA
jgi:hypothetical protein